MQHYEKEIRQITKEKTPNKLSLLMKLSTVLSTDGVLRVGERLKQAKIDLSKELCIIPHNHTIAMLIVREIHNVSHLGTEWVLSRVRAKYWITKARSVIKKVPRNCLICKKLYASPCQQRMADLPSERLEYSKLPFTYVGLDCLGTFYVKQGRSEVKRYGCVFT